VRRPGRIAFLLSGAGTTLANLLDRMDAGEVPGELAIVVSDRPDAKGLDVARGRGIEVAVVDRRAYADRAAFSQALESTLRTYGPDLVVLGGFLSVFHVPPDLKGRILNVHPSLLPDFGGEGFYGMRVHRAVLESGADVTGCTVHVVTDDVDHGPIVEQLEVPIAPDESAESLAEKVRQAERELYPRCIALFLEGRLHVEGDAVRRS
jgi:phosphoribosylglycinamide formyltransferase-1